jgi:hypothetical protein
VLLVKFYRGPMYTQGQRGSGGVVVNVNAVLAVACWSARLWLEEGPEAAFSMVQDLSVQGAEPIP